MNSESIVVLVLIGLAIGFIIWVRKNSHDHERSDQANNKAEEGELTRDQK